MSVSVIVLSPKDEFLLPRKDSGEKLRQTALSVLVKCRLEAKVVARLEKCESKLAVEVDYTFRLLYRRFRTCLFSSS